MLTFEHIHLMIAGRLRLREHGAKIPVQTGLLPIDFPSATLVLTEASTQKRASLHVLSGREAVRAVDGSIRSSSHTHRAARGPLASAAESRYVEPRMPPVVRFQGAEVQVQSIEEFTAALDGFDQHCDFELWLNVKGGPAICMLRNAEAAWLMYLTHEGDAGFTSVGNLDARGSVRYRLSNGQVDEYPSAWCLDVETCYKALAYFFVNDGLRPEWVRWRDQ